MGVDDVDATVLQVPAEPAGPTQVPLVADVEARALHAHRLELGDEVLLPRQQVDDLDVEGLAIVRPRRRDEQPLGAARPESLHQPHDAPRRGHDSSGATTGGVRSPTPISRVPASSARRKNSLRSDTSDSVPMVSTSPPWRTRIRSQMLSVDSR